MDRQIHLAQPPSTFDAPARPARGRVWPARLVLIAAIGAVVTGLAIDAYVHLKLADVYDVVKGRGGVSEGNLFRAEAVVAAVAAVLVLTGRRIWLAFAGLVAASAVAVLLVSTYVHVGAVGPFPDMYEPTWFPDKRLALFGELLAVVGAVIALALHRRRRSGR